jgi:hypothetical protein
MQRKITLGNSDGILLDFNTKQKIIDYIYTKLDLSKHRYIMLNNLQRLNFLKDNEHYVTPNFRGFNYLLIMVNILNHQYCVVIDRKKLSYHKNQVDIKMLQIIQINLNTTNDLYDGTIFDGKIIQTNKECIFLIQDCFYLMGKKILDIEMNQKINQLDQIIKSNFKKDTKNIYCSNFEFKLNKLYEYSELEAMIKNMPNLSIKTNGICFYPKFSGISVLYIDNTDKKIDKVQINTSNNEVIEQKSYHIISDFVNFLKSRTYSYETENKTKNYWLSRTLIPDVYDISENENGDKEGIAMIPNLKISQLCDDLIGESPVRFSCIYSPKFNKWIPLKNI